MSVIVISVCKRVAFKFILHFLCISKPNFTDLNRSVFEHTLYFTVWKVAEVGRTICNRLLHGFGHLAFSGSNQWYVMLHFRIPQKC